MAFVKGGGSRLFFDMTAVGLATDMSDLGLTLNGNNIELPFTTESFNPVGEFVNSNAIAGGRSRGIGCLGNPAGDGSLDTELSFENMIYLMYSALGRYKEVTDDIIDRPIVFPTSDELPTYDVYIQHGAADYSLEYKFANQKVNNFRMTLASNSILTASIDMVGTAQSKTARTTADDVDLSSTYMCPASISGITADETIATIGDETFDVSGDLNLLDALSSLDLTIANNIDTDTNKLDASGRMGTIPGELSVTGSMELVLTTDIQSNVDSLDIGDHWDAVYIHLAQPDDSPTIDYYLHLRNMYFTSVLHNIDGRGKVTVSLDFQCAYDTSKTGASGALADMQKHPIVLFGSEVPSGNIVAIGS